MCMCGQSLVRRHCNTLIHNGRQYIDTLCERLGLVAADAEIGRGFASVSAASADVRVLNMIEAYAPSPAAPPPTQNHCVARRFPRIRIMSEGVPEIALQCGSHRTLMLAGRNAYFIIESMT